MKAITHIKTLDGSLHDNVNDAKRYADKIFGLEVSKLAHKLVSPELSKYKDMQEFIASDNFIMAVRNIQLLKEDMILEKDNEFDLQ